MRESLKDLCNALAGELRRHSGNTPRWVAGAPGRVNLIGDHTDYSGGFAMPMGVNLLTVAVATTRDHGDDIRVHSTLQSDPVSFSSSVVEEPGNDWADYLRGVYAGYLSRDIRVPPIDVYLGGTLPIGAGLSSSASLELCFASLIEHIAGRSLDAIDRARLCQKAEHEYAGVPCGILDQAAIVNAKADHALVLDCRDVSFTQVSLPPDALWCVVDSGVGHALTDGSYAQRFREVRAAEAALGKSLRDSSTDELAVIEDTAVRLRARHVISENARVATFAKAITEGDFASAGEQMFASHRSLSEDFQNSCEEIDHLVAIAAEGGAQGARMTGGGFGGSVVCLAVPDDKEALGAHIHEHYSRYMGKDTTIRWLTPGEGPWAGDWSEL